MNENLQTQSSENNDDDIIIIEKQATQSIYIVCVIQWYILGLAILIYSTLINITTYYDVFLYMFVMDISIFIFSCQIIFHEQMQSRIIHYYHLFEIISIILSKILLLNRIHDKSFEPGFFSFPYFLYLMWKLNLKLEQNLRINQVLIKYILNSIRLLLIVQVWFLELKLLKLLNHDWILIISPTWFSLIIFSCYEIIQIIMTINYLTTSENQRFEIVGTTWINTLFIQILTNAWMLFIGIIQYYLNNQHKDTLIYSLIIIIFSNLIQLTIIAQNFIDIKFYIMLILVTDYQIDSHHSPEIQFTQMKNNKKFTLEQISTTFYKKVNIDQQINKFEQSKNESFQKQQNLQITELQNCIICFENSPNTVFMKCGHGGICKSCALKLLKKKKKCHLCRQKVRYICIIDIDNTINQTNVLEILKAIQN